MALPRKILGCRQAVRHSTLIAASRQSESDQPSFFNVFLINFIVAVLSQKWECTSFEYWRPKGHGGSNPSDGV